jgi:hypothetical protein
MSQIQRIQETLRRMMCYGLPTDEPLVVHRSEVAPLAEYLASMQRSKMDDTTKRAFEKAILAGGVSYGGYPLKVI